MKVILKTDVAKLGRKGQVVEVADGYGRNFLLRRGLAIEASKKALEVLGQQKSEEVKEENLKGEDALKLKEEIEKMSLTFKVKSNNGKMFGSVSSKEISEALLANDVKIDKRKIITGAPITDLGMTIVKIELYPKIIADLSVMVESE